MTATHHVEVAPELSDLSRPSRYALWRSRWAAIGAAVAVSFGAGGVFIGNADNPATPSSFGAITPVRVLDTRNDLGLTGVFTSPTSRDLLVTGSIPTVDGPQVVVPAGATAVVLNVTVVGPTASGFLSVRPANAAGAPSTSSINFVAGMVIANAVTVQIPTAGGDAGKIEITYNAFEVAGPTTHVLADVVGFYIPDSETATLVLSAAGFTSDNSNVNYSFGCVRQDAAPYTVRVGVQLPVGVTITEIRGKIIDYHSVLDGTLILVRVTSESAVIASGTTSGILGIHMLEVPLGTPELVSAGEYFFIEYVGADSDGQQVCGVEIDYTIPAGTPGA